MPSWSPPLEFEEYRLLEPLGKGGMGEVFLCRDTVLDRLVAVKFVSRRLADDAASGRRFMIEARAAARVHHPNVAAVFRVGDLDGVPYLVSEYVRGRSLATIGAPIPWEDARRYALDLARGLAAAHRSGVLHRDIKPSNAIVADDGGVKLIDFGLAKVAEVEVDREPAPEGAGARDAALTRHGAVMGTPYFIAPEVWRGEPATPRSDVYALGALIFELCSGRPPLSEVPPEELREVTQLREPPPLGLLLRGADARGFAAIVDRCLRVQPDARIGDAAALVEALEGGMAPTDRAPARVESTGPALAARLRADALLVVAAPQPQAAVDACRAELLPLLARVDGWRTLEVLARDVAARGVPALLGSATHPAAPSSDETLDEVEPFGDPARAPGRPPAGATTVVLIVGLERLRRASERKVACATIGELLAAGARVVLPVPTTSLGALRRLPELGRRVDAATAHLGSAPVTRSRRGVAALAIGLTALATALALALASLRGEPPSLDVRAVGARRLTLDVGCEEFPTISADGRAVVYDAARDGRYALFARPLDGAARELHVDGVDAASWLLAPALSPDGRWLAFLTRSDDVTRAHLVRADGTGPSREVAVGRLRPSWSPDGRFVWAGDGEAPVRWAVDDLREVRRLRAPPGTLLMHLRELEDGRVVALPFPDDSSSWGQGVVAYAADAGPETDAAWLWRGHVEEVLAMAPSGDAITAHRSEAGTIDLWRVPLDGGPAMALVSGAVRPQAGLVFSAGGDWLAWSDCAIAQTIARLAPRGAGGALVAAPLAGGPWSDYEPVAIPGSDRILAVSGRSGVVQIWELDPDGRTPGRPLPTPGLVPSALSVSRDGRNVLFTAEGRGVYVMPREGQVAPRVLIAGAEHCYAVFSADGREVLFQSEGSDGRATVLVMPLEGGTPRPLLDDDHPRGEPAVSGVGDVLAWIEETDAENELGVPMIWDRATDERRAASEALEPGWYHSLRFSPDGQRLLMGHGPTRLLEVELATGRVLRTFDGEDSQLMGLTYHQDTILVGRSQWQGDLWTASLDPSSALRRRR